MGFFGKKRNNVIDLTRYAKKNTENNTLNSDIESDVIDLRNAQSSNSSGSINSSSDSVNLGFLDNPINNSSSNSQSNRWNNPSVIPGPITDNLREARRQNFKTAFTEIKNKIEDSDYKISSLNRKIDDIEERLREMERRR